MMLVHDAYEIGEIADCRELLINDGRIPDAAADAWERAIAAASGADPAAGGAIVT